MINKICVYAICKNESQFVEKWLDSMSEADYIVILDTGSTDDTYEKLKNDPRVYACEQKVINPWRFDTARNESMKLIPEDANILVCTDLDELLDPGWGDILRNKWIEGKHHRCVYKYAWSHLPNGEPGRIFHYDKIHSRNWLWQFPVHEMLVRTNGTDFVYEENYLRLFDEIYLHHYPDQTKSRGSYLELLELRAKEYKEDWYGLIYLAHEYHYRNKYEKSNEVLNYILDTFPDKYSDLERASCYLFMGDNYREMEKFYDAINSYNKAIETDDSYREPYLMAAEVYNQIGHYISAISYVKKSLELSWRHYTWLERDDSWREKPYDILSVSYYYLNNFTDAYLNGAIAKKMNPIDERIDYNYNLYIEKIKESKDLFTMNELINIINSVI